MTDVAVDHPDTSQADAKASYLRFADETICIGKASSQSSYLSIPNVLGEVERSVSATIKGQNRRGQPVKIKAKGWLARIFQHEIDHLNGVLFVDKAIRLMQQSDLAEGEETPAGA